MSGRKKLSVPPMATKFAAVLQAPPTPIIASPKGKLARKVNEYLLSIYPREAAPRSIAEALGEKRASLTKALFRMEKAGMVVNVGGEGRYRAFADHRLIGLGQMAAPSAHAIQVDAPLLRSTGGLPPPGTHGWERLGESKQTIRREVLGRCGVTMQASRSGRVLVSVEASEYPIEFSEWERFSRELRSFCRGAGVDLDAESAHLVRIEFNVDWRGWFLSGPTHLKLRVFENQWAQMYQKHRAGEDVLRAELALAPRELSFTEAVATVIALAHGARPVKPIDPNDPGVA